MARRLLPIAILVGLAAVAAPFAALGAPPRITVPPNMTVEAQNFTGATVTFGAAAEDSHHHPLPVSCQPRTGSIFALGETTVTCTATDPEHNETARKSFKITVVDRTPPTVTAPTGKTVRTSHARGAVVQFSVMATDLVDGAVMVLCKPAGPGARFRVGTTQVVCTAADRRGNVSSAAINIVVILVRASKQATIYAPDVNERVTVPPILAWRTARKATYYNVQLYRHGQKILSAWPTRPRLKLHLRWRHEGRVYRLKPGTYSWFIWPGLGKPSRGRYGQLLGWSKFFFAPRRAERTPKKPRHS